MVPDAPVKNSAGEEEIIQFLPLVNLRGCSSDATFKGRRAVNPQSLWSHPNQHNSAEPQVEPGPIPGALGSSCPPAQYSLSLQINSFITELWSLLPLAGNRVKKGQHTGFCNYIAPCFVFYSENYIQLLPLLCGHKDGYLVDHFQCWPVSTQHWWLPRPIILFCHVLKLSCIEIVNSCAGDHSHYFRGFRE